MSLTNKARLDSVMMPLFHRLWGKGKEHSDYDKQQWSQLQGYIENLQVGANRNVPSSDESLPIRVITTETNAFPIMIKTHDHALMFIERSCDLPLDQQIIILGINVTKVAFNLSKSAYDVGYHDAEQNLGHK